MQQLKLHAKYFSYLHNKSNGKTARKLNDFWFYLHRRHIDFYMSIAGWPACRQEIKLSILLIPLL